MAWNRKEVANLQMVGASLIAAIQTAILGKWIDAKLAYIKATPPVDSVPIDEMVAKMGLFSTVILAAGWIITRIFLNKTLPEEDKLLKSVGGVMMGVYAIIAVAWWFPAYA